MDSLIGLRCLIRNVTRDVQYYTEIADDDHHYGCNTKFQLKWLLIQPRILTSPHKRSHNNCYQSDNDIM